MALVDVLGGIPHQLLTLYRGANAIIHSGMVSQGKWAACVGKVFSWA